MANPNVAALEQLNRDYIRSVQTSDVRRFDEILAEEFYCSNPDGSLVDRKGFLAQTARTTYTLPDGRAGSGRYTDVWQQRGGRWLTVSAHVTRC